jgi:predicted acyltransferase
LFSSSVVFTLFFLFADYLPKNNGGVSRIPPRISKVLLWLGTNSLVVFVAVAVVVLTTYRYMPSAGTSYYQYFYREFFFKWAGTEIGSLLYTFVYQFGYIMLVRWMYNNKIFVTL